MQQAVFMAHCPYELGDIVEVAIIEGKFIYFMRNANAVINPYHKTLFLQ